MLGLTPTKVHSIGPNLKGRWRGWSAQSHSLLGDVSSLLPFLWRSLRLRLLPALSFSLLLSSWTPSQTLGQIGQGLSTGGQYYVRGENLSPSPSQREPSTEIRPRWLTRGTREPREKPGVILPVFPSCICVFTAAFLCWKLT